MQKKILSIYYSQSGQLGDIVDQFCHTFIAAGHSVEKVRVNPVPAFAFPWTAERFFDAMPESVLGIPALLQPFAFKEDKYDLIIFAYQPWYLSPSTPANAVLQDPLFQSVVKDTPVITLIGARNMWLKAQERVKQSLGKSGAKLVGNIAWVDRNSNLVSGVTILYWMLTGKKDRMWGIFPRPGVADEDIAAAGKFAAVVLPALESGEWKGLQQALVAKDAVEVKTNLMFIEPRATKLFSIWANFISKRRNRKAWLRVFKYYLLVALFIVAPVVLLINNIFFRPFLGKSIAKKKQYYLDVNQPS